jgi:hypothetical protein
MRHGTFLAIACAGLSACSSDVIPGPLPPDGGIRLDSTTVVVSNAVAPATAGAVAHLVETSSYVSLPPGTSMPGIQATIRNRSGGAETSVFMFGGGFDPTPIAGVTGDTLEITVRGLRGDTVLTAFAVVPAKKRPRIIRTSLPPSKRDVPLNAVITIVFSEPMDPGTVASPGIVILKNDVAIPARVEQDSSGTQVRIIPESELAAEVSYEVIVQASVTDLAGDDVGQVVSFDFTTQALPPPEEPAPESPFVLIGNMTVARWWHSATLLPDGRVLIAGGDATSGRGHTAELYDPEAHAFTATGRMLYPRGYHQAVLLPSGKVLMVGPYTEYGAELYDPGTGTFTETGAPKIYQLIQTATLLQDGRVLIAGEAGAELYDPQTGQWSNAGSYARTFYANYATLLNDGRVLFAGDYIAQLYIPDSNKFTLAGEVGHGGAELHSQTMLENGRVLVAGGMGMGRYNDAFLFDPLSNTFSRTGSMTWARDAHVSVRLKDGRVLMVGGDGWSCGGNFCSFSGSVIEAELYDPATATFSYVGNTNVRRTAASGTLLANGDVLITGGLSYCGIGCMTGSVASAEIYPATAAARRARVP